MSPKRPLSAKTQRARTPPLFPSQTMALTLALRPSCRDTRGMLLRALRPVLHEATSVAPHSRSRCQVDPGTIDRFQYECCACGATNFIGLREPMLCALCGARVLCKPTRPADPIEYLAR